MGVWCLRRVRSFAALRMTGKGAQDDRKTYQDGGEVRLGCEEEA